VIAGGIVLQPAFGGGQFAILFGVAILRGDELGPQSDDLRLTGTSLLYASLAVTVLA
jgi:hypothetical protein